MKSPVMGKKFFNPPSFEFEFLIDVSGVTQHVTDQPVGGLPHDRYTTGEVEIYFPSAGDPDRVRMCGAFKIGTLLSR